MGRQCWLDEVILGFKQTKHGQGQWRLEWGPVCLVGAPSEVGCVLPMKGIYTLCAHRADFGRLKMVLCFPSH